MRRGIVAPLVILAVAVFSGGWLLQEGVDRAENVYVKVRVLQEVVDRVQSSFVDEVQGDRLYNAAIEGLIEDLDDPYSSFLPAREYEDLRIRTEGDYGGVGLEVIDRNGFVTVVTPMPGGPGGRAGIRAGDQFWSIDGVQVDTLDSDAAVELLRGRPGTAVEVEMLRPGVDEPIPFSITREVIRVRAVPFASLLDDGVGYVPFQSVLETSSSEIRAAIDSLRQEGMERLILDLRGNPGGLLDEGIAVSDLFLARGQGIVETRGRDRSQNEVYRASREDLFPGMPVVVLIDGASASASEIVAGALQDHDRALLIGEGTFGKGVVQSLYRLSGGNVLRLTTARWFTPLGRSIHKDDEERFAEIREGHPSLALSGQITTPPELEGRPTVRSEAGRLLYGGGGITPDLIVQPTTLTEDEEQAVRSLYRLAGRFNVALFNFAVRFVQGHPELEPGFRLTDADLSAFYRALPEWDVRVDRDDFRASRRFIEYQLEREIALQAWGEEGQFLQMMRFDAPLGEAVTLLRDAATPADLLSVGTVAESASTDGAGGS
ncbi:MAG: S41 family peptidase [Longimicrobiales bacterium]